MTRHAFFNKSAVLISIFSRFPCFFKYGRRENEYRYNKMLSRGGEKEDDTLLINNLSKLLTHPSLQYRETRSWRSLRNRGRPQEAMGLCLMKRQSPSSRDSSLTSNDKTKKGQGSCKKRWTNHLNQLTPATIGRFLAGFITGLPAALEASSAILFMPSAMNVC